MKVILGEDESVFATPEVRKFEVVEIPEEGKSKLKTLQYLDKGNFFFLPKSISFQINSFSLIIKRYKHFGSLLSGIRDLDMLNFVRCFGIRLKTVFVNYISEPHKMLLGFKVGDSDLKMIILLCTFTKVP